MNHFSFCFQRLFTLGDFPRASCDSVASGEMTSSSVALLKSPSALGKTAVGAATADKTGVYLMDIVTISEAQETEETRIATRDQSRRPFLSQGVTSRQSLMLILVRSPRPLPV